MTTDSVLGSSKAKAHRIESHNKKIANIEATAKRIETDYWIGPILHMRDMEQGDIGYLPQATVDRILDDNNAVVRVPVCRWEIIYGNFTHNTLGGYHLAVLQDSTRGMTDGETFGVHKPMIVDGTKRVGSSTLPVIREFDIDKWLNR